MMESFTKDSGEAADHEKYSDHVHIVCGAANLLTDSTSCIKNETV